MTIQCMFDPHDASKSVANKRAIGASLFILFLYYTACAIAAELKKGTAVSITTLVFALLAF